MSHIFIVFIYLITGTYEKLGTILYSYWLKNDWKNKNIYLIDDVDVNLAPKTNGTTNKLYRKQEIVNCILLNKILN